MTRLAALAALLLVAALAGCYGEPIGVGSDGCPTRDVVVEQDLRVRNMVGGGRLGPTAQQGFAIPLNTSWPAGARWSCVRGVEATIQWSNGASEGADLFVGLEDVDAGLSAVGQDRQQLAGDGAHTEEVVGPAPAQPEALADGLALVVYSDWASLSPSGLPVRAKVVLKVPASAE